jgi:hypothetical protein
MSLWRLWCKAVGEKSGSSSKDSDHIAFIRTLLILQAIVTNLFITLNIIISWLT